MADTQSSSTKNNHKKIIWFWQSDPKEVVWKRYSDFECDHIEEAFQRKDAEVHLNDYLIDFKRKLQIKIDDPQQHTSVKREAIEMTNNVREERYLHTERATKSFGRESFRPEFVKEWKNNFDDHVYGGFRYEDIVGLAAQGILKEGQLLKQDLDAQKIVEQLKKYHGEAETGQCVIRLYSAESFLYKLVNATLRNDDRSKIDTLGPFCWLLFKHIKEGKDSVKTDLYRGTTLTDEMIDEYKNAVGSTIQWSAFTSTSKDRRMAESFGNTLFIIKQGSFISYQKDISELSNYPNEQEVLFYSGHTFQVDKVEPDPKGKRHLIYLATT